MSLYSKALQNAVAGYSIIPLKKDKKPQIVSWMDFQKTPATEDILEAWWVRYPEANIGIVTGAISGITVVDIDTKGDTVVPLDTFPETFTVLTPSGGYHLYYLYDPEIKQTANTYPQFPHVDIRNDGGYVVGAGSLTSYEDKTGATVGGEYTIFKKIIPAPFPRHLFLGKEKAKPRTQLTKKIAALQKLSDGDGRNNAMCSLLGSLLRGQPRQSYPAIRDSFFALAETVNEPLQRSELEVIWNSIGGKAFEQAHQIDLIVNAKGVPYSNLENVKKIVTQDPQFAGRCVFDSFLQTYLYKEEDQTLYRDLHDSDEITLTREISVKYPEMAMINSSIVRAVLMEVARATMVDSAKDWLDTIVWDKTARLDTWLSNTYNVEDNPYHTAVGSNWLKGMARRITEPGCKFDYVLVLEGEQGNKKSTSLGVLGGNWHVETTASPDNKDFLMLLQGNVIIEFSEGETLSRGEIKQLKSLITTQYDKFRAPYERYIQTHPRRCVFAMTTNQTEYLKDETGNRRWLPVATIGEANVEWLRTNRDQLLAEALYRVSVLKEPTHEFPAETKEQQARRQVSDPNEDRIMEWYMDLTDNVKASGVTADMAYRGALGQVMGKLNKRDEIEITSVYKRILKLERKQKMVEGHRFMRWYAAGVEPLEHLFMTSEQVANEF